MTKEYCYDKNGIARLVGPSFEDIPMGVHCTKCPICRACLNQYIDITSETDKIKCKAMGKIPKEIYHSRVFSCEYFMPNTASFDYNLVNRLMEEEKKNK